MCVCVCMCEFNVERECGSFDQIKIERRITGYETRSENLISSINNSMVERGDRPSFSLV